MRTVMAAFVGALLVGSGVLGGFLFAWVALQSNTSTSTMSEYLVITDAEGSGFPNGWIAFTVNNTGLAPVTIAKVLIDNVKQSLVNPTLPSTVAADAGVVLNITVNLVKRDSYEVELLTSKGNSFSLPISVGYVTGQAGVVLYEANVNFYGSGAKIDIDIGNSGTSGTTITQVYIGTSSSTMDNQTITPVSLGAGSVQRITVNYSWQLGAVYYFRVLASTGQSLPWSTQAPTS